MRTRKKIIIIVIINVLTNENQNTKKNAVVKSIRQGKHRVIFFDKMKDTIYKQKKTKVSL